MSTTTRRYAECQTRCNDGTVHEATYSHEGQHGDGPVYAVVCRDGLTDYYTEPGLIPLPVVEGADLLASDPLTGPAPHEDGCPEGEACVCFGVAR